MADQDQSEKTEEPSAKKLEEAHEKGQVPKSQDVGHWFMLLGMTLVVGIFSASAGADIARIIRRFLEQPHLIALDQGALLQDLRDLLGELIAVLAPILLLLAIMGIAGNVLQHRPVLTAERLKPKFSKVSPLGGFKRQFSLRNLVDFLKGILKITIVAVIIGVLIWPKVDYLPQMVSFDMVQILRTVRDLSLVMLVGVLSVVTVIAAADYLYQRWEHTKSLRMSKQELKDEFKQAEGDPQIKARIRALRQERSRKRMMAAVPDADVVVTNPTHYAVALKYDADTMNAPMVVALGQDAIALKIREIAEENDVAIVENPPLARALYASADLDQEIPVEHYQAVAEIISYVMRLRRPQGRG